MNSQESEIFKSYQIDFLAKVILEMRLPEYI